MNRFFERLNYIFIHDENEQALLHEYLLFYGVNLLTLLASVIFIFKLITF